MKWIINIIYWLQAFLCPVVICVMIGLLISQQLFLPALIVGAVAGIILAEYIRRTFGLSAFFAGIYSTKEMADHLSEFKAQKNK